MTNVIKNFCITFEQDEIRTIDQYFKDNPHLVRSRIVQKLLVDWVKDQIKTEIKGIK